MKKVYLSLLSLLAISAFADPLVSNIRASQRENTKLVDILYDVSYSGGSNVSVTCEVSTNSGTSYTNVLAKSFSGNGYGAIVTTGTDRLITWNAGIDWNEKYSEQMKVRITAKPPRFTIKKDFYISNGDGNPVVYTGNDIITDNETGLEWASHPVLVSTSYPVTWAVASSVSWYDDNDEVRGGWRLPTRTELRGLLDTNRTPALPAGHPFTVRSELYWTSSASSYVTTSGVIPYAWCISVIDGFEVALPQTSSAIAWPVRSIY